MPAVSITYVASKARAMAYVYGWDRRKAVDVALTVARRKAAERG